ncbi:BnaC03g15370D [Brassica napus]|uniref:BnaC03g15370D protein n=1 Tax=Brassica napus TaxID=3708 RepID=A0A078IL93_BRANA|nr:BnaC03g15370D [Brassica napus]
MGEEHEGGYASTSDEHRRQGDSVIRVITTVACPCQPIELSPVYLHSIADGGEVEISGSPTEKAILKLLLQLGMKFDTIRSESAIIHAFPFYHMEPEDLLSMPWRKIACGVWLFACRTQELNKVPKEQEDLDKWSLLEDELTLLAIVGIKDPCRPGVREAVRTCTSAGVKVDPTKTPEALLWIHCSMDPKTVSEEGEEKHR